MDFKSSDALALFIVNTLSQQGNNARLKAVLIGLVHSHHNMQCSLQKFPPHVGQRSKENMCIAVPIQAFEE
jgi:hypothetical protein